MIKVLATTRRQAGRVSILILGVDMWFGNRRGAEKSVKKLPFCRDFILIAAGGSAYYGVLFSHPYLFSVAALP